MTTYRTDSHLDVAIVREGDGYPAEVLDDCAFCCVGTTGCPLHPPAEAQLVAVVVNGDQALAERICALLNGESVGYKQAVEVLADVATRTGSPAAQWAAEYLEVHGRSRPLKPTESAEDRSGVPEVTPGRLSGSEAARLRAVGLCPQRADHHLMESCGSCPYTQLAARRPRCVCNDPPPTVDKPKNGTASRPDGWACPRHGAVI